MNINKRSIKYVCYLFKRIKEKIYDRYFDDLNKRGLLDSYSDKEKIRELLKTPQTIYCGFDPSNKSMQLGNFIMIHILSKLQKAGHRIIAVVGGATGMIGDPSGKKSERSFLEPEQVNYNVECLKKQLSKYLDFSDPNKGICVNNYDWWSTTNVLTYLRDFGKMMPINYMLAKEIVKSRLEVGISYTEFSYMILQAGDFWNLRSKYGCVMQIGGGDQWGNLTTALDFVKKKEGEKCPCQVFSVKLICDSNGKKFGKSEKGALFLDPSMTSPFNIYQYFINVADNDVGRYLYIFDDRPLEELDAIVAEHMQAPEKRMGQKTLAYSVTSLVHGKEAADECVKMTEAIFSGDFKNLKEQSLLDLASSLDAIEVEPGMNLVDALINTKLASSKREAREFLKGNAVSLNGEKVVDPNMILDGSNALDGKVFFLKRGKKNNAAIILK